MTGLQQPSGTCKCCFIDTHNSRALTSGGVRCERASAYLRAKGPAFSDVLQLEGADPSIFTLI